MVERVLYDAVVAGAGRVDQRAGFVAFLELRQPSASEGFRSRVRRFAPQPGRAVD